MSRALLQIGADTATLRGILDAESVPRLWERIEGSGFESDALCVDLGAVEHADSAGLALLLAWMRLAREREVRIRFAHIPAQMLAIARVSGLDRILPLEGRDESSDDTPTGGAAAD